MPREGTGGWHRVIHVSGDIQDLPLGENIPQEGEQDTQGSSEPGRDGDPAQGNTKRSTGLSWCHCCAELSPSCAPRGSGRVCRGQRTPAPAAS